MVPAVGLEPTRLAPPDFESGVSTISPRWHACEEGGIIGIFCLNIRKTTISNRFFCFADIVGMELLLLSKV